MLLSDCDSCYSHSVNTKSRAQLARSKKRLKRLTFSALSPGAKLLLHSVEHLKYQTSLLNSCAFTAPEVPLAGLLLSLEG